jgi:hypothetical protein
LTTFTISGEVTFSEIVEVVESLKNNPPELKVIWDFSHAQPNDSFKAVDMEKIATLVKTNLGLRSGGRTAYIAKSDTVYGIIRMYKAYLEYQEIAHEVRVFRQLDEAHQWIAGDTD